MKIIPREESTLRQSPSVSGALSRIPSSRFQRIGRFFDKVEQHKIQLCFFGAISRPRREKRAFPGGQPNPE
jgi:hypothetical protein